VATLIEIAGKIAEALEPIGDEIPNLQIAPVMVFNPSPPTLDIYPADPFQEDAAFGRRSRMILWTVRARAGTSDNEAGQLDLLRLMEPYGPTSVQEAIFKDSTLDGTVENVDLEARSGHKVYSRPDGILMLGAEWVLKVFNTTDDLDT
jgi:hypothetical protein